MLRSSNMLFKAMLASLRIWESHKIDFTPKYLSSRNRFPAPCHHALGFTKPCLMCCRIEYNQDSWLESETDICRIESFIVVMWGY